MFKLIILISMMNVRVSSTLYANREEPIDGVAREQQQQQLAILEIALQVSNGCHFVVVTQTTGYSGMPFVLRGCFHSSQPLVAVDVDVITHRQLLSEEFIKDLWGSVTFTCRVMLIDFTGNDTNNIINFLDAVRLWRWPETRLLIIGPRGDVRSLLDHDAFKNSLYVLFVGLQENSTHPSSAANLSDSSKRSIWEYLNASPKSRGYSFFRLFSRCLYCNKGKPEIRPIQPLSHGSRVAQLYLPLSEHLDNFHGVQMKVITIAYFPYSNYKLDSDEPGTTVTLLDSLDKRTFQEFSSRANFSYVVRVPKDMIPGVVDSNGTWNGASGVIQRQEADFSTATSIFLERLIMSDYKRAYPADQFIIVSLKPQLLPKYLVIIRPYKVSVWITILVAIIAWGFSLWAIQMARSYYTKQDPMSLTTAIFFSFAVILEDPPSRPPSNFLGQMLVGWWLAVCFLLSTGYRSSLVAHLTAQGKTKPIDNYYDLVAEPKWRWGCDEVVLYGVADSYFRQSTTPVIKQVAKRVESVSVNAGLKKVLEGWYSLLTSRNRIRTEIEPNYANAYGQTPFYLSRQGYALTPALGWMFRKGAPFLPRFAQLTDRLIEGGIIDFWLKDVMASNARRAGKDRNKQDNKQKNKRAQTADDDTTGDETKVILRMGHMIGVFLTYLVGVLISTLVFVAENISSRSLY